MGYMKPAFPAGCGNHHVADIDLQGSKTPADGNVVDAVTILVGGKSGKGSRLAEKVMEDVPRNRRAAVAASGPH
jgi:sulfite reductase beta subunit-like hemoprotein